MCPPGSWAITSRTNVHMWPVEYALRAQRIRFSKLVKSTEPPQVSLFLSMLLTVQDGSRLGFELSLQTLDVQEHVAQALHEAAGHDLGAGTISLPQVDAEALKPVSTLIGRYGVWRNLVRERRYGRVRGALAGGAHDAPSTPRPQAMQPRRSGNPCECLYRDTVALRIRYVDQAKLDQSGRVIVHTLHILPQVALKLTPTLPASAAL